MTNIFANLIVTGSIALSLIVAAPVYAIVALGW